MGNIYHNALTAVSYVIWSSKNSLMMALGVAQGWQMLASWLDGHSFWAPHGVLDSCTRVACRLLSLSLTSHYASILIMGREDFINMCFGFQNISIETSIQKAIKLSFFGNQSIATHTWFECFPCQRGGRSSKRSIQRVPVETLQPNTWWWVNINLKTQLRIITVRTENPSYRSSPQRSCWGGGLRLPMWRTRTRGGG